jgi:putative transposase
MPMGDRFLRKLGKYPSSVLVDDVRELPAPNSQGKAVGIDLELTHFCITSDGSKFDTVSFDKQQQIIDNQQATINYQLSR